MTPLKIGLVQINNSFSGQNYLPYSTGLLQVFCQTYAQDASRYEFLLPIYKRLPVQQAVDALRGADVVAFSTYVWNVRLSLEIARRLKEQQPGVLIVFGGPQVPDKGEQFMQENPFVDVACHGEGERTFLNILEALPERRFATVPSISYRDAGGILHRNPQGPRIKEISEIPSPFLAGVFEPLMAANPDEQWIVMWETNRGCPFQCSFCDWGSATASKVVKFELDRIFREVEWFRDHRIDFVFCCDANFGMLPRDVDIAQRMADQKREHGYPKAFSIQSTKNATERSYKVQKILAEAGLNKGVSLSMQSLDPQTLKSIKRDNISTESYQDLQRRFTRDNIETYTDIILGLPDETYDSYLEGVAKAIENGQHNRIQFNNLSILPNAEMGDPEYQRQYGMVTVESNIINIHGSLTQDEVQETQQLVIATHAMPRADWVRTRTISWMIGFLYFDKLLQIPLILLRELCGFSYRELFEAFVSRDLSPYPVLREIHDFYRAEALRIQGGGEEYTRSEEWLNIWWPADEYVFIKLSREDKLDDFYTEARNLLRELLEESHMAVADVLDEAVQLNRSLMNQPFQTENLELTLNYNVWEFWRSVLVDQRIPLEMRPRRYHIDRLSNNRADWDTWYREIVWWGNKKGAYIYRNVTVTVLDEAGLEGGAQDVSVQPLRRSGMRELAGHF
jgi:radical SAM superfamily enzyme YgiQ (UPF0313 family)